jgi:hypothetical protein
METTITKHKPLSELTLLVPNVYSWKAYTSHNRDVAFHSYVNESALFIMEVPDSYPSPIALLLKASDKTTIASCIPTYTPGSKPDSWDIIVPIPTTQEGPDKLKSEEPKQQARSIVQKIGKEDYNLSVPWLQAVLPASSSTATLVENHPNRKTLFHWRKQAHQGSTAATFSRPDWKLINAHTQEVQAVFIEKWGVKERGSMQFRRSFGREWELCVVLSIGLIVEEGRRRRKKRGNFPMGFAKGHGGVIV